jgi:catechol 2,3-dioxygenase-like lactoylglutathione lyase family enzyme
MNRFHVHIAVGDLDANIRFYTSLFGAQPTVVKPDYAKWMLDDPRVNFAISARGAGVGGVNHLGLQVETDAELAEIHRRLQQAESAVVKQQQADCCYARSDKYWIQDPQGIAWESFHTLASVPFFGGDEVPVAGPAKSACCAPAQTVTMMPRSRV